MIPGKSSTGLWSCGRYRRYKGLGERLSRYGRLPITVPTLWEPHGLLHILSHRPVLYFHMKFLLGRPLFLSTYECKKGVEIGLPICVLCHLAKSTPVKRRTCVMSLRPYPMETRCASLSSTHAWGALLCAKMSCALFESV